MNTRSLRHLNNLRDMTERSITQWALINALVFAERAGLLVCAGLFLCDPKRDFWSVPGIIFTLIYLLFLSPVYGIGIFLTERGVYKLLRKRGRIVPEIGRLKKLGWSVNIFCLPFMVLGSAGAFDLFYSVWAQMQPSALQVLPHEAFK